MFTRSTRRIKQLITSSIAVSAAAMMFSSCGHKEEITKEIIDEHTGA